MHYEYADDLKPGDVLRFGKPATRRLLEVQELPTPHPESTHHLSVVALEGATGQTHTLALNRGASYALEGSRRA